MEHESFEDAGTAKLMNDHFVCIKVDREERPDLDTIYMNALQVLTREGGGWPLSVFLTPDLTPFYAGTYYPPDERYAPHRPSFKRLLLAIHEAWTTRRDQVQEVGTSVAHYLQTMSGLEVSDTPLSTDLLANALAALRRNFDASHGGFGTAPKFPHALELRLLLRLSHRFNDPTALHMVRYTLEKMARGGMYDQLGGGFHRYSVDERWLVPHFEKMLYDNALLTLAYIEAWELTREPFYEQIVRETLNYVLREMTAPGGAFYSTQDADSEGEEGKFYIWSQKELLDILGPELGALAKDVWGVTEGGNFEGQNILYRSNSDEEEAKRHGLALTDFRAKLDAIKQQLYQARSKRVWPGRDEKILTAWNGLMIGAFARAGATLAEPRYIEAATQAANWVLQHLLSADRRLLRCANADGAAKLTGYLEDYAFLADALVTLYEATFDPKWLSRAQELADVILQQFADPTRPGFYFTAHDHEQLLVRTKDLHDGSTPSGNSVAVMVLLRLAKLLDRRDFAAKADQTLRGYRETMAQHPAAAGQMLIALDFYLGPSQEVAIIGQLNSRETNLAVTAIRQAFRPRQVVAFHDPTSGSPPASIPLLHNKPAVNDTVTVYVCENFACQAPLVGAEAVQDQFGQPRQ
jgi:hypothetical protein